MRNTQGGIDLANKCALSLPLLFIEAAEIGLGLLSIFFFFSGNVSSALSGGRVHLCFHKVIL